MGTNSYISSDLVMYLQNYVYWKINTYTVYFAGGVVDQNSGSNVDRVAES